MKKITYKSISFSDVKNCVFCLQIDPEFFLMDLLARSDDLAVMYVGASSIVENGYKYFICVSIFLEINFAEIRASVRLFMCYCLSITILCLG